MSAPITTQQAIAHLAASVPADASDTSRALVALARQVAELRVALARAADEPNIDRARRIADELLHR